MLNNYVLYSDVMQLVDLKRYRVDLSNMELTNSMKQMSLLDYLSVELRNQAILASEIVTDGWVIQLVHSTQTAFDVVQFTYHAYTYDQDQLRNTNNNQVSLRYTSSQLDSLQGEKTNSYLVMRQKVEQAIERCEPKTAVKKLKKYCKKFGYREAKKDILLLQARLAEMNRDKLVGQITQAEFTLLQRRLLKDILDYVDALDSTDNFS